MKIISSINKTQNKKRMYGYDIKTTSASYVSSSMALSPRAITKFEIVGMKIEKREGNLDCIRIQYNDGGKIKETIEESSFRRSEEDLERENSLLFTYSDVAKMQEVKEIKCTDFLEEVKGRLKEDIRYGYKGFYLESNRNSRHSVYIYQVYAIIIAILSIYSDVDFKKPNKISLIKNDNGLTLKINMNVSEVNNKSTRAEILKESINEAREIYLEALCKSRGSFTLSGQTLCFEFIIDEAPKDEFKLFSKPHEEEFYFAKLLDIFNSPIDKETEEGEEE